MVVFRFGCRFENDDQAVYLAYLYRGVDLINLHYGGFPSYFGNGFLVLFTISFIFMCGNLLFISNAALVVSCCIKTLYQDAVMSHSMDW